MNEFTLPEGMTGEDVSSVLRSAAKQYPARDGEGYILTKLADAIDPPTPPSVVTDEMVEVVLREAFENAFGDWTRPRALLEAAESLGWLRDPDENLIDWESNYDYVVAEHGKQAERLEMAEGLLRKARHRSPQSGITMMRSVWASEMTTAEAEYLRSLDGEGEN